MLKKSYQKGFTVVELLIVIVVIGILAALVLNTFAGIQQRARDTERKTDVNSIATQLEAYYNTDGEGSYPTDVATIQAIEGLDADALVSPANNSLTDAETDPSKTNDVYVYESDGSQFTITWFSEEADDTVEKTSLN